MSRQNPGDPLGMLKSKSGYQPLKTFVARNVPPQATSNIQLSGGKNKPYYYSLASTSTIPFAAVEGSGGIQKEFSWGEVIEIPPGITVNVKNSSRHAGDIIIESGEDRSNTPARISFPISFTVLPGTTTFAQDGFVDTRRARRCYWVFQQVVMPEEVDPLVSILGYYAQHTANPEGNNIFDTASWIDDVKGLLPLQAIQQLPICLGADYQTQVANNMLPMMLADYQRIFYKFEDAFEAPTRFNFVVLEYL